MFFSLLLFPALASAFTLSSSNMQGWNRDEISFRLNPANCSVSAGRIEDAINHAVNLWNSVPTSRLKITYNGQTSDSGLQADPVIDCVTSGIAGAIGVGTVTTSGGVIQRGEIQLNSQAGDKGDISGIDDDHLRIAVAHEMGHVFGIGHSGDETALMYFSIGQKTQALLSQDDMDALTWLYPRNEPGDGAFGCGTLAAGVGGNGGGPGGTLLWLIAMAALVNIGLRLRDRRVRRSCPLSSI